MTIDKLVIRLSSIAVSLVGLTMLAGCAEEGLRNYVTFDGDTRIRHVVNPDRNVWSVTHYPDSNTCIFDTPWNYGSNDHLPRGFPKNSRIPTDENPLPVFDQIINEGCRRNLSGWNFVRMHGNIYSNPHIYSNGTELSEEIASYFDLEATQFAPPLDPDSAEIVSKDQNSVQQALKMELFFRDYY